MTREPDLRRVTGNADVLLVVPPFGGIDRPSLGVHLLQACAMQAGIAVDVYYANLAFAQVIGERAYEAIAYAPGCALIGERIFARAAYAAPPLGRDHESIAGELNAVCAAGGLCRGQLDAIERMAEDWAYTVARRICDAGYRVVGCSSTFEQTAASAALLHAVKRITPATITLLGGANCDGPMAGGVMTLKIAADHVFSGESERTFVEFLRGFQRGQLPGARIICGQPCADLDGLPVPDYTPFFRQASAASPDAAKPYGHWLVYETSRGCWWGEKRHCTFCGLNAQAMSMRRKSAPRVIADLQTMRQRHGSLPVCLTDNIMPHEYLRTLLPQLPQALPGISLFYEIKANLTLAQVRTLVQAGVHVAQPGIEALSTRLLESMRKGTTARQNLALLRHARACGLELRWNLLYGLPGDQAADYEAQLALLPLLRHLEPPQGVFCVTLDRFSPYHHAPAQFGIRALRPASSYRDILPASADAMNIAYHFDGEFDSESRSNPDLIERLRGAVAGWRQAWDDASRPLLAVIPAGDDGYLMIDTRGLAGCATTGLLDASTAAAVLFSRPMRKTGEQHRWAREHQLAVELDDWHVGLATAEPALLEDFERRARVAATTR